LHAFEQELNIDPNDEDVRYRIARLLTKQGEYKRALALLNTYIENHQLTRGKPFFYRALVFHALGDDLQAKQDMMHAMSLKKSEQNMAQTMGLRTY